MENPFPRRAAANPTQYNIDAIAKLEHEALDRRSPTERVSDVITKLVGNLGFILAHLVLIAGWGLADLHAISGLKAFDPFPFGVLALVVSSESVFLTIFVLISQSRMARRRKNGGTHMNIGNRLSALQASKKLSQGNVEKRTGLLRCYIPRVENGHTVPNLETMDRWACALEVEVYQLFYEGARMPEAVPTGTVEALDKARKNSSGSFGAPMKQTGNSCFKLDASWPNERHRVTCVFV